MPSVLSSALLIGLLGGSAIARPCPEGNPDGQWWQNRHHSWPSFSWPGSVPTALSSSIAAPTGMSTPPVVVPSMTTPPVVAPTVVPTTVSVSSAPSSIVKPVNTPPASSVAPSKASSSPAWSAPASSAAKPTSTGSSGGSGATTSSPPSIDDVNFQNAVLKATNDDRAAHSANPVTWDDTLAAFAQDKANNACGAHATGSGYGENLYWTSGSIPGNKVNDFYTESTNGVQAWYSEAPQYNPNDPNGGFPAAGHFTQLVWKSTTAIGCAWGQTLCGSNSMWEFRCEYNPPGNYGGQYTKNVS